MIYSATCLWVHGCGFESMRSLHQKNSPTLQRGFPNVNLIISGKDLDVTVMCCSYVIAIQVRQAW